MIKKEIDVIVVGELNVDLILNQIDSFPEMGKEKIADKMHLTLGSSSAIFASNLSSLGKTVSFIGAIGKDSFGDLVIDELKSKNVKTEMILKDEHQNTGATIVLNFDEDRAMVTYPGAMNELSLDKIDIEYLNKAKHLHFSSFYLQPKMRNGLLELFKKAKEKGLTTSFDMQWDPEEKWDFDYKTVLPFVDVFLPNDKELQNLTRKTDIDEAVSEISKYANIVAVKMGNKGSLVIGQNVKLQKSAFLNENVIDAIGAGDSFNAGFIYKFIEGKSLEDCQEFGNLMGAVNTTAAGGTAAFKSYEHIINLVSEKFGYKEAHETAR